MEHHIDTWPNVPPIYQKQQPIHPSKVAMVKADIEKLREVGCAQLLYLSFHYSHFGWMDGPLLLADGCHIKPCVDVVFHDGWI